MLDRYSRPRVWCALGSPWLLMPGILWSNFSYSGRETFSSVIVSFLVGQLTKPWKLRSLDEHNLISFTSNSDSIPPSARSCVIIAWHDGVVCARKCGFVSRAWGSPFNRRIAIRPFFNIHTSFIVASLFLRAIFTLRRGFHLHLSFSRSSFSVEFFSPWYIDVEPFLSLPAVILSLASCSFRVHSFQYAPLVQSSGPRAFAGCSRAQGIRASAQGAFVRAWRDLPGSGRHQGPEVSLRCATNACDGRHCWLIGVHVLHNMRLKLDSLRKELARSRRVISGMARVPDRRQHARKRCEWKTENPSPKGWELSFPVLIGVGQAPPIPSVVSALRPFSNLSCRCSICPCCRLEMWVLATVVSGLKRRYRRGWKFSRKCPASFVFPPQSGHTFTFPYASGHVWTVFRDTRGWKHATNNNNSECSSLALSSTASPFPLPALFLSPAAPHAQPTPVACVSSGNPRGKLTGIAPARAERDRFLFALRGDVPRGRPRGRRGQLPVPARQGHGARRGRRVPPS